MPQTPEDVVRQRIGERIPTDGSEADTMFTDTEITQFLEAASGVVDAATLYAWEAKAAELANLVNVQEGPSRRDLSGLHKQALDQVEHWRSINASGVVSGGTKIRKIARS